MLSLLFVGNTLYCMDQVEPFTLQDVQSSNVSYHVYMMQEIKGQCTGDSQNESCDPWQFIRDHIVYKRLSISSQEVKDAYKKQLFSLFDARLNNNTPPYETDDEWLPIRRWIALCALVGAKLGNQQSQIWPEDITLSVAERQNDQQLVELLKTNVKSC